MKRRAKATTLKQLVSQLKGDLEKARKMLDWFERRLAKMDRAEEMTPFTEPITPCDVTELIDFTVADNPETASMAKMQSEGVAALYNILCKGPVAYLADEVGMGKTYQALGTGRTHMESEARGTHSVPQPTPEPAGEVDRRLQGVLRLELPSPPEDGR